MMESNGKLVGWRKLGAIKQKTKRIAESKRAHKKGVKQSEKKTARLDFICADKSISALSRLRLFKPREKEKRARREGGGRQ